MHYCMCMAEMFSGADAVRGHLVRNTCPGGLDRGRAIVYSGGRERIVIVIE